MMSRFFALVALWKLPLCHCSGQTVMIPRLVYSTCEKFLFSPPFLKYISVGSRRHFEQTLESPVTALIQLLFALHPVHSSDE